MSDTLVTNYDEVKELKAQLAELRKNKEREIRQLEVAIYDGKKENEELRKQLAEIIHLNQAVSMLAGLPTAKEMDTLVKDGKRLDWLLDENSCNHIERGRYNRLGDWLVKTLHNRSDIDKEMEEL